MNTNTTPPPSDAIAQAIRDVCESDPANPDDPETIKISVRHLTHILEDNFGSAREIAAQPGEGESARSDLIRFLEELTQKRGQMVSGNQLSMRAAAILASVHAASPPKVADALDGETVLAALRKHVEDNFTSQLAFAQSLCVSSSYVSDVLNGRREIPPDWVFCLGFRKAGWERFNPAIAARAEAGDDHGSL